MALLVTGAALLGGGAGVLAPGIADGQSPACADGDACVQTITGAATAPAAAEADEAEGSDEAGQDGGTGKTEETAEGEGAAEPAAEAGEGEGGGAAGEGGGASGEGGKDDGGSDDGGAEAGAGGSGDDPGPGGTTTTPPGGAGTTTPSAGGSTTPATGTTTSPGSGGSTTPTTGTGTGTTPTTPTPTPGTTTTEPGGGEPGDGSTSPGSTSPTSTSPGSGEPSPAPAAPTTPTPAGEAPASGAGDGADDEPARTLPDATATVAAPGPKDGEEDAASGRAGLGVREAAAPPPAPSPAAQAGALPWGTATAMPAEFLTLEPVLLPLGSARDVRIPPELLPLFQAAGAEYGIPWEVLAAINEIETGFGRDQGPSSAGAVGWMQFMPESWSRWGVDADGDRARNPSDPADAIFAAAKYLADHGAARDLAGAIFAYNRADWYVRAVLRRAREFAGLDAQVVSALTARGLRASALEVDDPTPGQALLLPEGELRRRVLEGAEVYDCGRDDVDAGRIDRRVLATIAYLTASGLRPTISSLECGHSVLTAGGNVSAHAYGHAVDIAAVDGKPIIGHQGPGSITERTLQALVRLQGEMRPNQIISLMVLDGHPNTIAMGDHHDHVHVGFPRAVRVGAE